MALAALGLACGPTPASAHAVLLNTTPAAGTVAPADAPPRQVALWFSEPVEVAFNGISVVDANGKRVDGLDARVSADDPRRVEVGINATSAAGLPQGAYVVRWRATSVDNHVVAGTFWFAVGFATTVPAAALIGASEPQPAPLEVMARWLALLGLLALAGSALFLVFVLEPATARVSNEAKGVLNEPRRLRRLWLLASAAFLAAHVLWAIAQAEAVTEVALPQALDSQILRAVLLSSRFGALLWVRIVLGVVLALLLIGPARRGDGAESRRWLIASAGIAVLLCLSVSLGGHAASARWTAPLAVAMDVLHLAAASLWLGGLALLSMLLPPVVGAEPVQRAEIVRSLVPRTSQVALASVLVLVGTGAFSAWEQSGSVDVVVSTAYGQALLVKLGLLAPLLVIAAANRFLMRPRLARLTSDDHAGTTRSRRFSGLVRAEVLVGSAVLFMAALLTSLAPPAQQGLPGSIELARQAGDLRVALTVDPAWVGVSRFGLVVTDSAGQPAADVSDVILTFTMEGMNMGRTTVRGTPRAPGVFDAQGFYLGMPGVSLIGVAISRTAAPEQSAVFRVELPNITQDQFQGLLPTLNLGPPLPLARSTTLDEASLARGQQSYAAHCLVCHGETGIGNGPAAASLLPPPADLTLHARWHSDAQLFWFITHGVAGTPMPGFADELTPTDRWEIIAHVHTLAAAPTASPPREAPAPSSGEAVSVSTPPKEETALTGNLVFGPDSDKDFWLLRFPTEPAERLTQFSRLEFSSHPVWSPDGRRLAFSFYALPRVGAVPAGTDLYIMDGDGRNMRMLASHDSQGAALLHPAWSPDGSAVYVTHQARAAAGGTATRVDRVDADSGELRTVVANAAYPSPSRDGHLLAYVSLPNADGTGQSLWMSSADGRDPRQLVPVGAFIRYSSLRFAPDGQRILFAAVGQGNARAGSSAGVLDPLGLVRALVDTGVAHANGEEWDFWTIDPDGRNLRRLTSIAEDLPVASWSPGGDRIAFLGGGSARTAETGLAVMAADGTNLRRLTTRPGHRGADWSPRP